MKTELDADLFKTVDQDGNPVDTRLSTTHAMRVIFGKFQEEDSAEAFRRKRLADMYNCHLPYNPEKLKKLGLANLANFNSGDLRGFIDSRVGVVSELALDIVPLVELRPWPASAAGPLADHVAEVVADEFSTIVRDENRLLPCLSAMFRECDLYGLAPVTWKSSRDYSPVSLRRGQLKFRMDGPILSSDHEIFMFESPVTIHYFKRLFKNPEKAKKEGWNVSAIRSYLISVFLSEQNTETQPGDTTGTSTEESALVKMRQNRWDEVNQFRTINLVHAYVKETDGKIRHLICAPHPPVSKDGVDEFIYNKKDAYAHMDECLIWMPASVVEQEARGSRGIASLVAPIADINNRLLCQMYDAGFRAGSFMLVSRSPGQHHQQTIVERGPYTVFPADLTPSPHQMVSPNIQQIASLRDLGNSIGFNNTTGTRSMIGGAPEKMVTSSDRKTKEEVQREENNRSKGEQMLFAARVLALDKIFRETFRRFVLLVKGSKEGRSDFPEVERFRDRCILRGVPEEALTNLDQLFGIYTNRVLVTGGGEAHASVLSGLLGNFGGMMDEVGRARAMHDVVRYRLGMKSANRYRPEASRDTAASNAISFATLENSAIKRNDPVLVGDDQLHWSHIPVHMELIGAIAQQYRENPQSIQEPQRMLDILQAASQHVQAHAQYGGGQPGMKASVQELYKQLASLAPIVKGLTMMAATIERQRRAEAEKQQREMEELQERARGQEAAVAIHESDNKAQLKAREQDLMHDVRLRKVSQDGQIQLMKAENEAKARIAKGTERFEQGADILGLGRGVQSPGARINQPDYDEAGDVEMQ